ncbi:hypothetical protein BKA81DRAFT_351568 [Phyllosticta paracitricarpa]|uniref:Uncharacterized protein n=1 Tax=Phyllosticta citricarpa TaxID=55181 RepID=A0ABR1MP96_9PEZI
MFIPAWQCLIHLLAAGNIIKGWDVVPAAQIEQLCDVTETGKPVHDRRQAEGSDGKNSSLIRRIPVFLSRRSRCRSVETDSASSGSGVPGNSEQTAKWGGAGMAYVRHGRTRDWTRLNFWTITYMYVGTG